MMNLSKAAQLSYRSRKRPAETVPDEGYDGSEALLQGQAEEYLDAMQIEYRRVPDSLWRFLKQMAHVGIIKPLADMWRGKPDLLMLIPINEKYSLACELELKSKKGEWGKRQKDYREIMPVQESRSPEKTMATIEQFRADAEKIKKNFVDSEH